MQTEFEATFLNIGKEEIRKRLKDLGAKLVYPEFLQKRVNFHPPKKIPGAWIRVRQEADKITMSLKAVVGEGMEGQKEAQVVVNNFDDAVNFLKELGAEAKNYQETKRERWVLGKVEIDIDTWPGLNPYVEIEATGEAEVKRVAKLLGFDYDEAYFGAADGIYEKELGIPKIVINNETPVITFEKPPRAVDK